jgi:hypothetical protein
VLVVFVEGAEALGQLQGKDRYRIYFGAADATEGSAVVEVDAAGTQPARRE